MTVNTYSFPSFEDPLSILSLTKYLTQFITRITAVVYFQKVTRDILCWRNPTLSVISFAAYSYLCFNSWILFHSPYIFVGILIFRWWLIKSGGLSGVFSMLLNHISHPLMQEKSDEKQVVLIPSYLFKFLLQDEDMNELLSEKGPHVIGTGVERMKNNITFLQNVMSSYAANYDSIRSLLLSVIDQPIETNTVMNLLAATIFCWVLQNIIIAHIPTSWMFFLLGVLVFTWETAIGSETRSKLFYFIKRYHVENTLFKSLQIKQQPLESFENQDMVLFTADDNGMAEIEGHDTFPLLVKPSQKKAYITIYASQNERWFVAIGFSSQLYPVVDPPCHSTLFNDQVLSATPIITSEKLTATEQLTNPIIELLKPSKAVSLNLKDVNPGGNYAWSSDWKVDFSKDPLRYVISDAAPYCFSFVIDSDLKSKFSQALSAEEQDFIMAMLQPKRKLKRNSDLVGCVGIVKFPSREVDSEGWEYRYNNWSGPTGSVSLTKITRTRRLKREAVVYM